MVEVGGSSPLASTKKAATLTGGGFFDTRKTEEPTAVRASAFLRDTFVRSTNSLSRLTYYIKKSRVDVYARFSFL